MTYPILRLSNLIGEKAMPYFLAHLSTKCSWWAFVIAQCPSCSVVSPSGPLPRLFIWCPWGPNWPRPWGGHKFETYEQRRKTLKFFFSETRKCRALIFGMKHLLVDLYQDCSYDAPGVKTGLAPGVTISKHRNKDGKLQNSSFLKLDGAEVWYLVCSIS